jgi:hypothetical protein
MESLQEIISRLWITPDRAEWFPRLTSCHWTMFPGGWATTTSKFWVLLMQSCTTHDFAWTRQFRNPITLNSPSTISWRDSSVPRSILTDLKFWLGGLYKTGSPQIRTCVVQATLEHLFEQKDIRKFFSDWQNDAALEVAYDEASEWYKGGGRSPLGRPPLG